MKTVKIVLIIALLSVWAPAASPQRKNTEAVNRYLLLATTKTSTMQKELDEASAKGYRILVGSQTSRNEMALFLELVAKPPEIFRYKLLATTQTSTMERELNKTAKEGFRMLPRTMMAKGQLLGPIEVVVLLERPPKVEKQYEYKLLATRRSATMQIEASEALAAGFVLVGMISRGEHMVIMEKETDAKPQSGRAATNFRF
jgi:hypothetical protein